jgi:Fe-S-cluster-containing dehydrogenase component
MSFLVSQEEYERRRKASNAAVDREKRRLIIEDYKRCMACRVCREKEPACLDFHHTDPAEKDFTVSEALHKFSLKRIMAEISKCIVLCANCHRKYHAGKISLE